MTQRLTKTLHAKRLGIHGCQRHGTGHEEQDLATSQVLSTCKTTKPASCCTLRCTQVLTVCPGKRCRVTMSTTFSFLTCANDENPNLIWSCGVLAMGIDFPIPSIAAESSEVPLPLLWHLRYPCCLSSVASIQSPRNKQHNN